MNQEVIEFKKKLIIDTAEKYFREFGYDGTQIDKIAKELSIGVGTIYSFFESKSGLFYHWLFSITETAYNEIKTQFEIEKKPILQCEIFVKYKFMYYEKNKSIFRDFLQNQTVIKGANKGKENPMKKVYKLLAKSIEEFIKEEKVSNEFTKDCYNLAYVLDGLINSYIECYSQENPELNMITKTKDVMRMFLNAIGMGNYEY
ncbi:TetR/AcrR family transcriptional regulator [bacterium]|nr:TetR/AcrR family transcriptional regulator [bacterium]